MVTASTYDFNNNKAVRTLSNLVSYMDNDLGFYETNVNTLFVDTVFKYKDFSLMGEYAKRNADDPFAKISDNSFTGNNVEAEQAFNLQAGYLFKNNYKIVCRFTNLELDKSISDADHENNILWGF